jgi:hypothetical protein
MERHRQLDHAKSSPEVPACNGHRFDEFRPQLIRNLPQLVRL